MKSRKRMIVFFVLLVASAAFAVQGHAADDDIFNDVSCECSCKSGGGAKQTKVVRAPGGDPRACGNFNGIRCKVTNNGGSALEGKLEQCEAVVELPGPDGSHAPSAQPEGAVMPTAPGKRQILAPQPGGVEKAR